MAVAEIIGAAIGTMLLIIVAYLLVGNVLTTAEVVSNAQKDMTLLEATRLNTDISLEYEGIDGTDPMSPALNFTVTNTGNQVIYDFRHATVFSYASGSPALISYDFKETGTVTGTWTKVRIDNDLIHPGQLDPGEKMWVMAYFNPDQPPTWFEFCTNNGVYASAYRI
jgi:archaeal flagellar protein FlaF